MRFAFNEVDYKGGPRFGSQHGLVRRFARVRDLT